MTLLALAAGLAWVDARRARDEADANASVADEARAQAVTEAGRAERQAQIAETEARRAETQAALADARRLSSEAQQLAKSSPTSPRCWPPKLTGARAPTR